MYIFKAIPKSQQEIVEIYNFNLKLICKCNILEKPKQLLKKQSWELTVPDFMTCYIRTTGFWQRFKGEKIIFSTSGTEIIGYPFARNITLIHISLHKQKLSQDRSLI